MQRAHKTVRVDKDLIDELDALVRARLVPVTFADQVDAGLRLLVDRAHEQVALRSSRLVAADDERARDAYRRRGA